MKNGFMVLLIAAVITGCGTVKGTAGGFFEGAGEDFKTVGDWIKK